MKLRRLRGGVRPLMILTHRQRVSTRSVSYAYGLGWSHASPKKYPCVVCYRDIGCSGVRLRRTCAVAVNSTTNRWRQPLLDTASQNHTGAMVALGKFDALHKGHRALVVSAAGLGGVPFLLSFSGMADVLGWPHRLPLVPAIDRERVLHSWAEDCRGYTPKEWAVPFSEVGFQGYHIQGL